jgi:uncharacterized protein (TIGR02118 family)
MIKVTALFPNKTGSKFDTEYYFGKHVPMVQSKLGEACKKVEIEQGLSGLVPGSPATYSVVAHMYFDSVNAFLAAFKPHAQAIIADMANYTDLQPTLQISEVKL